MKDDKSTRILPITIGLHRLIEDFKLQIPLPETRSEIVASARRTIVTDEKVLEQYPKNYMPKGPIGNLRFALRYEPIVLGVYLTLFQTIDSGPLADWIRSESTSIFARRAWYLYELLIGQQLDIPDLIPSGTIDLLDPEIHFTGPRRLVRRQRINDNLLGSNGYSPLVRKTNTLKTFVDKALASGGERPH